MFTVLWWVLGVGAVVVLALVLLRLWRSGTALLRALGEASVVLDRFDAALRAAQAARAERPDIVPQLDDDLADLRAEVARLRVERLVRRYERRTSHEATYRRWAAFNRVHARD
ncbi:hypothetical protein [Luteimicrobium subarcticum]|uniref:Uncharacterized protein n=1 Tax=Luteimicrobium subarcticum TaxID=620910 RepID=A0A2M8W3T7_9MICO|nr:hypothetical protein [Luteimicrobium subarcticum]PJI85559.1 hypothetical protein CLV34_2741 [Luteimicrobium subarcticum]